MSLSASAQSDFPTARFGGLSTNTAFALGDVDSVKASFESIHTQGVEQLRIELRGNSPFGALDTLLSVAETYQMDVFVAIPDTQVVKFDMQALSTAVASHTGTVKAYTMVYTNRVPSAELADAFKQIVAATPGALHGVSVRQASDHDFNTLVRLPGVDFVGLVLGYKEQGWASLDRVQQSLSHVFSRLPQAVQQMVRVLKPLEKPLLIDYIDYPRDRAYHQPDSSVRMRENVVNLALRLFADHDETLWGIFLGEWVPNPAANATLPTEVVYDTDTRSIARLVSKTNFERQ